MFFKKIFLSVFVSIFILFIISCENDTTNPNNIVNLSTLYDLPDSIDFKALLLIQGTIIYTKVDNQYDEETTVAAYFCNSSGYVNPSAVNLENEVVQYFNTGRYFDQNDYPSSSPYEFDWDISGYLGGNYTGTQTVANPLRLSGFYCADTISKQSGTTISYTGTHNTNEILVQVIINAPLTMGLIDHDSANVVVSDTVFTQPDDGSLELNSGYLGNLAVGKYYDIRITHNYFEYDEHQNENIAKASSYTLIVPFYLSN